jgi:hypothetical protein
MNDLPIQGEHHKFCFPAIRDVRQGDWGTNCFTCAVLGMAEYAASIKTINLCIAAVEDSAEKWSPYDYTVSDAIDAINGLRNNNG